MEAELDRLSTSAVRIDLFNYFINSYVTSITYTEIQGDAGGCGRLCAAPTPLLAVPEPDCEMYIIIVNK